MAPTLGSFRMTSDTEKKREGCWASGFVFGKRKRPPRVAPNLFFHLDLHAYDLDLLICSFLENQ